MGKGRDGTSPTIICPGPADFCPGPGPTGHKKVLGQIGTRVPLDSPAGPDIY